MSSVILGGSFDTDPHHPPLQEGSEKTRCSPRATER